jgi:hypothetical protein
MIALAPPTTENGDAPLSSQERAELRRLVDRSTGVLDDVAARTRDADLRAALRELSAAAGTLRDVKDLSKADTAGAAIEAAAGRIGDICE